jgi:hypothetical protein
MYYIIKRNIYYCLKVRTERLMAILHVNKRTYKLGLVILWLHLSYSLNNNELNKLVNRCSVIIIILKIC